MHVTSLDRFGFLQRHEESKVLIVKLLDTLHKSTQILMQEHKPGNCRF